MKLLRLTVRDDDDLEEGDDPNVTYGLAVNPLGVQIIEPASSGGTSLSFLGNDFVLYVTEDYETVVRLFEEAIA